MTDKLTKDQEVVSAFRVYDRQETIDNFKVACILGMILMPAGFILDANVYPKQAEEYKFFQARLLSSVLIAAFLAVLLTKIGQRYYRLLGVTLFMIPASFIAWMIAKTEGAASPYYAGLNLVLLVLAFVLHWTFWESLTAATLVIALYLAASFAHGGFDGFGPEVVAGLVNNLYFLSLTGIIVVTGSYFHSRSRLREFSLRHQLSQSQRSLEENNIKLDSQNKELADTIQKLTEAESQLVQSEKMASLGRMSAGIIHEINNPLNFATTGLFTLKKKTKYVAPEQQGEYSEILKDIEDGVTRVKNIVSDLRMFTHPNADHLDEVDTREVVASALRFLSNEMKDKVVIEQELPEHFLVYANKHKLIHVFVNLIQNAIDATRGKTYPAGERPTIRIEGHHEPGAHKLTIRDNGPGIPAEHIDKIFDPFYTTKDVGEGMGLGLSICYRIMAECQGKISVRTEPGKFCEFTLEFPIRV
jgi:two-component system sensor histidine kinase PhcS